MAVFEDLWGKGLCPVSGSNYGADYVVYNGANNSRVNFDGERGVRANALAYGAGIPRFEQARNGPRFTWCWQGEKTTPVVFLPSIAALDCPHTLWVRQF